MTRFIHTADWQLGMTRHFLSGEAQSRFTGARIDAVRTIGRLAVANNCDFVVVAGDVFETNFVDRQIVVRALDAMGATPEVTFYLLPGNHDPLDAASVFRSDAFTAHQPSNVVVLDTAQPVEIGASVELIGAPWFSKRPLCDLVNEACVDLTDDGVMRIVVGHGAIDTLSPDSANPALISIGQLESLIETGAIHYVALGDRHSTTDVSSTGRIHYSGAPEPTDFRETAPGNALIVDIEPDHCSVEPVATATWTFIEKSWHVNGAADLDAFDDWTSTIEHRDRCIVKLGLVGQISLSEKARLDEMLEHYRSLFASVQTSERRSDLAILPSADDLRELQLSGFAGAALDELRQRSAGGTGDGLANEALSLLFRLGSN